jgi:tRNA(fMet)-specific endonuclease VapC
VIHLDTNVAIAVLNERDVGIRRRFDETLSAGTPLGLSAVVLHELMYGAAVSRRREANEQKIAVFISSADIRILAFEDADAAEAADIRAHLRRAATPIGPYDLLIAAQARRRGAAIVTANRREFERVPGLVVTDWTA